VRVFL